MRHNVMVEEPSIKSHAALVLLSQKYLSMEIEEWIRLKRWFLKRASERDGCLKCHYCGKTGLVAESDPSGKGLGSLATIDHVLPVSKGGSKTDESNLVVACWGCNHMKGDNLDFFKKLR
jgi:5-methylcytosine-specific restriction endonuclease McrA